MVSLWELNHYTKGYFQVEIIINVLVSYFRFILNACAMGPSMRGSTLNVRIWRLQTSDSDV